MQATKGSTSVHLVAGRQAEGAGSGGEWVRTSIVVSQEGIGTVG